MKPALLYGIIGAGAAAVAVIVGIVFVMPQLTAQSQSPQIQLQTQSSSTTSPPTTNNTELLKQQDPAYAHAYDTTMECAGASVRAEFGTPNPGDPPMSLCMTTINQGIQNYCTNPQTFHQTKCDFFEGALTGLEIVMR